MNILQIGCGWLGKQVALKFLEEGFSVTATTFASQLNIQHPQFTHLYFHIEEDTVAELNLKQFDVILLFLNPSQLQETFLNSLSNQHTVIVMSSISIYGNQGTVNENTLPLPQSKNGKHLLILEEKFPQFTFIRLGGLVGPNRNPAHFIQQKDVIELKNEVINLVHSEDVASILPSLVSSPKLPSKLNLVAPFHPKKIDFYKELCPDKEFIVESEPKGKLVKSIHEEEYRIQYKNVNLLDLKRYDETPIRN